MLKTLKTFMSKNKSNSKGSFCLIFKRESCPVSQDDSQHKILRAPPFMEEVQTGVTMSGGGSLVMNTMQQRFCNAAIHPGLPPSFQSGYFGAGAGSLISFE